MSFKETELGKIPLYWDVAKLGDVADVLSGFAFKSKDFVDSGVPVIKIKNIVPPYVTTDDTVYVSQELYELSEKYQLNYNDILISMTGSNYNQLSSAVGKVGRVRLKDKPMLLNQRVGKILTNEKKCNKEFLYYNISTMETRYRLALSAGGSANQANVSPKQIKSLLIPYPPLEEQKVIAHILSTLDEKIEVNNQINKTLENMAQAIFKQWFVDFEFPNEEGEPYKSSGGEMVESELGMIPKGWEVGKLDDIATIVMGQSPKGTSYNEVGEGEVFYQGRTDFSSRFPIRRLFTTEPKRMANDGDVLMSVRAPVGDLNVANERCCIGRGLSAISSSADLSSYILYVMHDLRERLNVYNGEGTVFGSINQKDLKSIKVISSCDNKTEIAFDDLIQPIDRMIRNNEDETRRLINLRDRLLPKLLSGEIRVPLDEEGDVS